MKKQITVPHTNKSVSPITLTSIVLSNGECKYIIKYPDSNEEVTFTGDISKSFAPIKRTINYLRNEGYNTSIIAGI